MAEILETVKRGGKFLSDNAGDESCLLNYFVSGPIPLEYNFIKEWECLFSFFLNPLLRPQGL